MKQKSLLLSQAELYFFEDPPLGCYSPRNELEALNSMISLIDSSLSDTKCSHGHALRCLRDLVVDYLTEFGDRNGVDDTAGKANKCDEESGLLQWGERNGVNSRLQIARKCFTEISMLVLLQLHMLLISLRSLSGFQMRCLTLYLRQCAISKLQFKDIL